MTFWTWSRTAASNATADSTVNYAEGQAPSSLNDSARAAMAALAKYRDDIAGAITTGGTSTAYTVTSYEVYDTLAHMNGAMIAFTPHATNGATVTLNVDGLGAKPLRSAPSVELPAGTLIQGTPYTATYNNSDSAWYLHSFFGNPYGIPIGGLMPFAGTTAPNSSFVFAYGQAISRTTYSSLFSVISTSYGSGDGSTTFNVPDVRGRAMFGKDDMGGSAASRITSAGSSIDGTSLGATGGGQNTTMQRSDLPQTSVTVTITDPGHTHTPAGSGQFVEWVGSGQAQGVGATNQLAQGSRNTASSTTGITAAFPLNGNVSQTTMNRMPPAIIIPVLLRVI